VELAATTDALLYDENTPICGNPKRPLEHKLVIYPFLCMERRKVKTTIGRLDSNDITDAATKTDMDKDALVDTVDETEQACTGIQQIGSSTSKKPRHRRSAQIKKRGGEGKGGLLLRTTP